MLESLFQFTKLITSLEFERKPELLCVLIIFWKGVTVLNSFESTKVLYNKKGISVLFFGFLSELLRFEKQDQLVILYALHAMLQLMSQKLLTLQKKDSKMLTKRTTILDFGEKNVKEKEKTLENIVAGMVAHMRRAAENEELQLKALELLRKMATVNKEIIAVYLKAGISRFLFQKLDDEELTSQKQALEILALLLLIAKGKKEALLLFNNQSTFFFSHTLINYFIYKFLNKKNKKK